LFLREGLAAQFDDGENLTMGNPSANPHGLRSAEYPPVDGYHSPEHPLLGVLSDFQATAAIQSSIPVVASGSRWLQELAIHAAAGNLVAKGAASSGWGGRRAFRPILTGS
jgi:NADPH2 dehydrogenase